MQILYFTLADILGAAKASATFCPVHPPSKTESVLKSQLIFLPRKLSGFCLTSQAYSASVENTAQNIL